MPRKRGGQGTRRLPREASRVNTLGRVGCPNNASPVSSAQNADPEASQSFVRGDGSTHSLAHEITNTGNGRSFGLALGIRVSPATPVSADSSESGNLESAPRQIQHIANESPTFNIQNKITSAAQTSSDATVNMGTARTLSTEPVAASTNPSHQHMTGIKFHVTSHEQRLPRGAYRTTEVRLENEAMAAENYRGKPSRGVEQQLFMTDTTGFGMPIVTGLPPPMFRRSLSPTLSDSSEEIILFSGRNKILENNCVSTNQPLHPPMVKMRPKILAVNDPLDDNSDMKVLRQGISASVGLSSNASQAGGPKTNLRNKKPTSSLSQVKGKDQDKSSKKTRVDDGMLSDYIANIRANDTQIDVGETSLFNRRDLGPLDGWKNEANEQVSSQLDGSTVTGVRAWDNADLHDFDNISTSSEMVASVGRVLSKRERSSGVQYLVVRKGDTLDDAKWLPQMGLRALGIADLIAEFEEQQRDIVQMLDVDERDTDYTEDTSAAIDLQDDNDGFRGERDLEERRKTRMSDEQFAKLLSKQEELGMGSDDLFLFDGLEGESAHSANLNEQIDSSSAVEAGLSRYPLRSKTKKRTGNGFPSACHFAQALERDPYNNFDVMDQARPCLVKRTKGRRGKPNLELSDSELERFLANTWQHDRSKKKARKQEREELRAEGLLGKRNKLDLKAKYAEGMSMDEVNREIKTWLLSSAESLPLPPMGHRERRLVHEVANLFSLKSKSIGGGKSRFPNLYKTVKTPNYTEESLSSIDFILNSRRFLPRLDKARRRVAAPLRKGRGDRFSTAGVSYRDGEVVGATAPELGQENKGRAMLEKMGWSTGTALGALNNKGISVPVLQTVKTTRAGLG